MKNKNYKDIKTFTDACVAVGITEKMFYDKHSCLSSYLLNTAKLEIINKAINGTWVPDWNNTYEYKYYPYFVLTSSMFAYSSSTSSPSYSVTSISSRLCFETGKQANYAGEQFMEIYKLAYTINEGEPSLKEQYTDNHENTFEILEQKSNKLSKYKNCTIDNIVSNNCKYFMRSAVAYWVSIEGNIPERDPDAMIIDSGMGFYTILGGRKTYDTFEKAYKDMLSKLKRMRLIN